MFYKCRHSEVFTPTRARRIRKVTASIGTRPIDSLSPLLRLWLMKLAGAWSEEEESGIGMQASTGLAAGCADVLSGCT